MNFVPFFLLLVPVLLLGVEPQNSLPGIKDQAGYFSPQIVNSSQERIQDIKEKYEIDIFLESYAKIPKFKPLTDPLTKSQPNSALGSNDEHFFDKKVHDWFESKNALLPPNSVQILIVRDPGYIIVGVGRAMRYVGGFKKSDDNTLTKIMQSHFQSAKYDEALLNGLDYIENVLKENLSGKKVFQQALKANESGSKGLGAQLIVFFKQWGLILSSGLLLLVVLFTSFKIVRETATEA